MKKGRITASKYEYPNIKRKATEKGKGNHTYQDGHVKAKADLEAQLGCQLNHVKSTKGQWVFERVVV